MLHLAKCGFSQSYTYFTWRNTADELREFVTELNRAKVVDVLRPIFFTNTPDILHAFLQAGGRPAFEIRLLLAATLSASYGIYSGFELCENVPVRSGSEEYLDSEKYQIRPRDWNAPGNLSPVITRMNTLRRAHAALRRNHGVKFHGTSNHALLWYSRSSGDDRLLIVVTTDPHYSQDGSVQVPAEWRPTDGEYTVEDLLDGTKYRWHGEWNYVRLDPWVRIAHVFQLVDGTSAHTSN